MLILILLLCCVGVVPPLSAQEVRPQVPEVPAELVELFFKDLCPTDGIKCTDDEMALWRSKFTYEAHDLNGDEIPEYFLFIDHHDWCGAGSNCGEHVYMKSGGGYKMLLSDVVLRVMKTRTRGFRDIESRFKMGACTLPDGKNGWEIIVTSYKFNGTEYKALKHKDSRCLKSY
jgi:hypothetical protein